MTRQLNIAGKNSDEIYTLFYPNNLINFCRYDFSLFLDHCTDLCRLAARSGEYNVDEVYSIRNSISGCHKYYEQNMRTVFEKIVVDCWIDYLCKQSDISFGTLWQSFMKCRTPFETAIFSRLSDYRYNRAINEWNNLVKMQEYARTKVDFVFGVTIRSSAEASARANYFDLLFNVAANEQGFPIGEIASTGIFSAGRLPNSPFVMNTAAREIARNQLKDMEYRDTVYKPRKNPDLTDKTAMDAFAAIKEYIPDKNDSMAKTIIKSMTSAPQYIYMPGSFKAIIDIEIDATAHGSAFIQKCARCGDYYIRDEEYDFDYCSRPQKDSPTCLEFMKGSEAEGIVVPREDLDVPESEEPEEEEDVKIIYVDKDTVTEKMDALYKEMAARVNVDLTQRDFSRWYQQELRLKEHILLGEAGERELNRFIELSHGDEFASKKQEEPPAPPEPPKAAEPEEEEEEELTENGKPIKKFVFEKVERPAEAQRRDQNSLARSEQAALEAVRRLFGAPAYAPPVGGGVSVPINAPVAPVSPAPVAPVAPAPVAPAPVAPAAQTVPISRPLPARPTPVPTAEPPADDPVKQSMATIEALRQKKREQTAKPAAPVQPVQTIQPVQPVAPVQPVTPVQPIQQVQPVPPVQPVTPVQPAQPVYQAPGFSAYNNYASYYRPPQQQPIQRQAPSKVIRGASFAEPVLPSTVVIPTGSSAAKPQSEPVRRETPSEKPRPEETVKKERVEEFTESVSSPLTQEQLKNRWMGATKTFPRLSTVDPVSARMAESVFRPEPDVKVFVPKKTDSAQTVLRPVTPAPAPEPSPYEKLRTPLREYRRERENEPSAEPVFEPEPEPAPIPVPRPAPTAEAPAPRTASAGAISAYRSAAHTAEITASEAASGVKEDFSRILDGIKREDGFEHDEELVDSDGLPVSHKTRHVMNAIFSSPKTSPLLHKIIDDDD